MSTDETELDIKGHKPKEDEAKAKVDDDKEDIKKDRNVWQSLLRKSTTKSKDMNSSLIVLGDKKNGKTAMLDKFTDRKTNPNSPEYVLDYSYVEVKNKHNTDKEETLAHMNIWQIDDPSHVDLLPMLLKTTRLGVANAVYMITINLAEPWNIMESLTKWLTLLTQANAKVLESFKEEERERLKRSISHHIQFFSDPSVKKKVTEALTITEEETSKVKIDPQKPPINLGVPLLIVGCKADYFSRKWSHKMGVGSEGDERFDFLTRRLRKLCLDYGAALIYTSAVGTRGSNVEELQDYIYHRLYPIPLIASAKVVGSNEDYNIYIPSGHDNADLITADRVPSKQGWNDDTPFEEVFKSPQKKRKERLKETKLLEAQPNDDFFKGLMEQLEKGPPIRDGTGSGTRTEPRPKKTLLDGVPVMPQAPAGPPTVVPSKPKSGSSGGSGSSSKAKPDTKNNQAVKQFFRSLLVSSKGGPPAVDARATRAKAKKELLREQKFEQGDENTSTGGGGGGGAGAEDASRSPTSSGSSANSIPSPTSTTTS